MLRIHIAGGVSSHLFAVLLESFLQAQHHISATAHESPNDDEAKRTERAARLQVLTDFGVKFMSREESLKQRFDAVLWLASDHSPNDLELLSTFRGKGFPTAGNLCLLICFFAHPNKQFRREP